MAIEEAGYYLNEEAKTAFVQLMHWWLSQPGNGGGIPGRVHPGIPGRTPDFYGRVTEDVDEGLVNPTATVRFQPKNGPGHASPEGNAAAEMRFHYVWMDTKTTGWAGLTEYRGKRYVMPLSCP